MNPAPTTATLQVARGDVAGRDHDAVGPDRGAVIERDTACRGIERRGTPTEASLDPELAESGLVRERRALGRPGTCQHLLGQWRAVIGDMALVAHHDEPPGEPTVAERLCRAQARE